MPNPPIQPYVRRPGEPEYRPEGLREPQVGDKVRYRISPECPYRCTGCGKDLHHFGPMGEGVIEQIGVAGTMRHTSRSGGCGKVNANQRHHYGVVIEPEAAVFRGFWACLAELEVIEPALDTAP